MGKGLQLEPPRGLKGSGDSFKPSGRGLQIDSTPRSYRRIPITTSYNGASLSNGDGLQIEYVRRKYRRIPIHPSNYIRRTEDEDGNPKPIPVTPVVESIKKSQKTKKTKC